MSAKTPTVHPDLVYDALTAKPGRSERRYALGRLHAICTLRHQSGNTDFSVATVGKECEAQGIFKARVLYNASSADYKTLLDGWSVFAASVVGKGSAAKEHTDGGWSGSLKSTGNDVSRINDPVIRVQVLSLMEECARLRVSLAVAEAEKQALAIKLEKKVAGEDAPSRKPRERPLKHAVAWTLKPGDLSALKRAISPGLIKERGRQFGLAGEVRDARGEMVYEPGYLQGIKKVLANAGYDEKFPGKGIDRNSET